MKALLYAFGLVFLTETMNSQWFDATNHCTTDLGWEAVGVGSTFGTLPNARLQVSNFSLANSGGTLNGRLFHTDGNSNIVNQWQIFTGPTTASLSERFRLWTDGTSSPWTNFASFSRGFRWFTDGTDLTTNARMQLNDLSSNAAINGYSVPNAGFLLVGRELPLQLGGTIYGSTGAFSQLHINGPEGPNTQESGYRLWMRPGIVLTNNADLAYFGHQRRTAENTDLTIAFGDNYTGVTESDNLRFAFVAGDGLAIANDPVLQGNGVDGSDATMAMP
jgi:hypothetical protein